MRIDPGSQIDRSILSLFFAQHKNTAEIARQMDIPEHRVDRVVARELDRLAKRDREEVRA